MDSLKFTQEPENPNSWIVDNFKVKDSIPSVLLIAVSENGYPDENYIKMINSKLNQIEQLIIEASDLILENYSYDYFKKIGVDDSLLVKEETPEKIASVVTLEIISFYDSDGESYELSFSVPWDKNHSFDVEFEDNSALTCSVNG